MALLRFAVPALIVLSAITSEAVAQGVVYCDNPRSQPTYQLGWIPSHEVFDAAFDSSHLFISNVSDGSIERYALNGAAHVTWPWQATGVLLPGDLAIHPLNGDLYVAPVFNGRRISFSMSMVAELRKPFCSLGVRIRVPVGWSEMPTPSPFIHKRDACSYSAKAGIPTV